MLSSCFLKFKGFTIPSFVSTEYTFQTVISLLACCLSLCRLLRIMVFEGLWWFPRLQNFILVVMQWYTGLHIPHCLASFLFQPWYPLHHVIYTHPWPELVKWQHSTFHSITPRKYTGIWVSSLPNIASSVKGNNTLLISSICYTDIRALSGETFSLNGSYTEQFYESTGSCFYWKLLFQKKLF